MNQNLITATRNQNRTHIELAPVLDVAGAGALKKQLEKVFRRKPPFELDGSAVERVDTAALQVLIAFARESRNREIELEWSGVSESLSNASSLLGLAEELGIRT